MAEKNIDLVDVEMLDGELQIEGPCLIIAAELAQEALNKGQIEYLVQDALRGLDLTGKQFCYLNYPAE